MRKSILLKLLLYSGLTTFFLQSCKDDGALRNAAPVADQSFVQEFDSIGAAKSQGWLFVNRSEPIGSSVWKQGPTGSAYSSKAASNGCVTADYNSANNATAFVGTISNWLISPSVILQNNDKIIFYTRTEAGGSVWGDRLQVKFNPFDDDPNPGRGDDPGSFTQTLLDINPANASSDATNSIGIPPALYKYDPIAAFPETWTRFEAKVTGLSQPTRSRFALRYYVPHGGSNGLGDIVFVDSVAYVSASRKK
jgi:hypothetical protein